MSKMKKSKAELTSITMDNFKSTADLTSNAGFQSTLTISSIDNIKEKEYEPYDHRQVQHPNSDFGSLVHLLKSSLGSGILAMPNAFKNAGFLFGTIGTIVLGIICTHCVHILVKLSHELCKKSRVPSMTFAETCEASFKHGPEPLRKYGSAFKSIVDWALVATYIGTNCVYVVLIADSFHEVIGQYVGEEKNLSIQIYCVIMLVPLIILGQIRNLKYLVPFSAIANTLLLITMGIIMYYIFQDIPPLEDKPMFTNFLQLPMFISTVIFAMEGIGVIMPIENEMKSPGHFLGCPGVLNIAMSVVVLLYVVIGLFGYLKYGDNVLATITATLCEELIPAQIAKIFIGLAIFFTYALQFYVPMDILFRKLEPSINPRYHNWSQIMIRTIIVAFTVVVAIVVPHLDLLISFVGAVFFSSLGLLVPAFVEIVYCWNEEFGFLWWKLWKDLIIVIFAIIAMFSGAYLSLSEMITGPSHVEIHNSTCVP